MGLIGQLLLIARFTHRQQVSQLVRITLYTSIN
jgi:hypothetical protein